MAPSFWRKLAQPFRSKKKAQTKLVIELDPFNERQVYTNGSILKGSVKLTPGKDLPLDSLEVAFIGETTTHIQTTMGDLRRTRHKFLEMNMPTVDDCLPESRLLEAQQTYSIPFSFTIPHSLGTGACSHLQRTTPNGQHLQLPPSIGYWTQDDQAPAAVKINYSVRAKMTGVRKRETKPPKIVKQELQIKVLPSAPTGAYHYSCCTVDNTAPYENEEDHNKAARRTLFPVKMGQVKTSALSAQPVVLSTDTFRPTESILNIGLEFAPEKESSLPPDFRAKSIHLETFTHYSFAHINKLPLREAIGAELTSIMPFFATCKVQVQPHESPIWSRPARSSCVSSPTPPHNYNRDSGIVIEDGPATPQQTHTQYDDDEDDGIFSTTTGGTSSPQDRYKTSLRIPFTLPARSKRLYLPTFHSCIVSRSYNLRVLLSAGPLKPTITVNVPLEIVAEGTGSSIVIGLPDYSDIDLDRNRAREILPEYAP